MIEKLEAMAILEMVNAEQGGLRSQVTCDHQGETIEIRARRKRNGDAVLGYSYGGVRLERSILLLLTCPQTACEVSIAVKKKWTARSSQPLLLQRRPRTGIKTVN